MKISLKAGFDPAAAIAIAIALTLASCGEKTPPATGLEEEPAPITEPEEKPKPTAAILTPAEGGSANFPRALEMLELGGDVFVFVDIQDEVKGFMEQADTWTDALLHLAEEENPGEVPQEVRDFVDNGGIGQVMAGLGIDRLGTLGMSSTTRPWGFHNRTFLHLPDGPGGIIGALAGEATPFTSIELAPADSDLLIEIDLNLKSAIDTTMATMKDLGFGEQADQAMQMLDRPMGQLPMTGKELYEHLDTEIVAILRIDPEKTIGPFQQGAPAFPAIDLLLSLHDMGWLVDKLAPMMPEEQVTRTSGDGFESFTFASEIPMAEGVAYQPVIYKDLAKNKLLLASSPAYLEECLAAAGALRENPDFVKATTDISTEGTSFSYISPRFYDSVREIMVQSMTEMETGSEQATQFMQKLVGLQTPDLDTGVAGATTPHPDGILYTSNSPQSHRSTTMSLPAVTAVAVAASMAFPAYNNINLKAKQTKGLSVAKQLSLACHVYAADNEGAFPKELGQLIDEDILPDDTLLSWRNPKTGGELPWGYIAGLDNTSPFDLLLLHSPEATDGQYLVALVDGSAQIVSSAEFKEMKRKTTRYLKGK